MRGSSNSRSRTLALAALVAAALLCAPASALASRKLGLSSGAFKFNLDAGKQASGEVIVMNDGTEPLKVMVYAADQKVNDQGGISYVQPTRTDIQSLDLPSAWTVIKMPSNSKSIGNVPYMELAAGQQIPVKFTITVPDTTPPGDHNVLIFFESFVLPTPGQGAQSVVQARLGARITLRVNGPIIQKLGVAPVTIPQLVWGGSIPYSFTVRNQGNVDQRVGARAILLDQSGNETQRATAIDGMTVFANSNLDASGTLTAEKLPIGPFRVKIDVSPVDDSGKAVENGGQTISEEHTVWLIPWWFVVAVVAIVVLIFIRIVWMAAARSTRRKDSSGGGSGGSGGATPATPAPPAAASQPPGGYGL